MPIRFLSTAKPYGDYPVAETQDIQHGDKRLNTVIGEIQTVNAGKADKTYVDTELAKKVDKVNGKGLSTNDYTTAEKTKLAGIAEGATNVTVDSALSTTSTNAVQNKAAATAINSKAEKSYVDTEIAKKVDKETGKGLSTNDYTTAEKTKLAGIATGATKVTVDDTLSATSSNPIANGPVATALSGKVDKVTGKGLSTNDYTSAEKTKLSGIEAGATKTIVDDTLTTSSTNPIQNKAVATALSSKVDSSTVSSLATTVSGKADSSTVSALASRVSINETNIATQTARIDNIAVLPSGSTSGDAELMDIRVGADSVTYSSAGAAVRSQISDVKSDLAKQSVSYSKNVYNSSCRGGEIIGPFQLDGLKSGEKVIIDIFGSDSTKTDHSTYFVIAFHKQNDSTHYQQTTLSNKRKTNIITLENDYVDFSVYNSQSGITYCKIDVEFVKEGKILDTLNSTYSKKRLSILGDSWSTFRGYITPNTNGSWYPPSDTHTEGHDNDVESVKDTWWYQFAKDNDYILDVNNSYSGSPVCNYNNYAAISFLTRMDNIGSPDLLIVEGGTNDYNISAPIGSVKYSGWTESDLEEYAPALCYMFDYLTSKFPNTKIVFVLNGAIDYSYKTVSLDICTHYGINTVYIESSISKGGNHPNKNGMLEIKKSIEYQLIN